MIRMLVAGLVVAGGAMTARIVATAPAPAPVPVATAPDWVVRLAGSGLSCRLAPGEGDAVMAEPACAAIGDGWSGPMTLVDDGETIALRRENGALAAVFLAAEGGAWEAAIGPPLVLSRAD